LASHTSGRLWWKILALQSIGNTLSALGASLSIRKQYEAL
jgi:hypothetical protein